MASFPAQRRISAQVGNVVDCLVCGQRFEPLRDRLQHSCSDHCRRILASRREYWRIMLDAYEPRKAAA